MTSSVKAVDRKEDGTYDHPGEDSPKETKLEAHGFEGQNPKMRNSTESAEDHSQGNNVDLFHSQHSSKKHICPADEVWDRCGRACEHTCRRRGICLVKVFIDRTFDFEILANTTDMSDSRFSCAATIGPVVGAGWD